MNLTVFKPETIVNEVFALYEKYGRRHAAGNSISQLEEVSEAAALAEEEGFEDEVILAAFFHNIGYVCATTGDENNTGEFGNANQGKLGADYLRQLGFSERLAILVESDMKARRYLAYKYPEYYTQLSETEKSLLQFQGGPMSPKEADNFEIDPDAELFIRLRYLNDKAKKARKAKLNIPHIKLLAMSHLYKIIDQYLPAFLMPKAAMRP